MSTEGISRPRRIPKFPVTAHHSGDGARQSAHSCDFRRQNHGIDQWKPWFLPSNIGVSCKFSHHPILWHWWTQKHNFKKPSCSAALEVNSLQPAMRTWENMCKNCSQILFWVCCQEFEGMGAICFLFLSDRQSSRCPLASVGYPGVPPFQGVLVVCQGRMPQLRSLPAWFKNRTLNRSDTSRSCRALDFKVLAGGVSAGIAVTSSIASNAPFGYPVPFLLVEMPIHADCLGPTG